MTKKHLKKIIKKLADLSFKDGRIVESQVIRSIKALKSLPQSEAIAALGEYLNGVKRIERQFTMVVETSSPLAAITVNKMRKIVERKNKQSFPSAGAERKITRVIVNINPEILGGFKLKIGDEIWDESILGKINQLKEVISSGRSSSSN